LPFQLEINNSGSDQMWSKAKELSSASQFQI